MRVYFFSGSLTPAERESNDATCLWNHKTAAVVKTKPLYSLKNHPGRGEECGVIQFKTYLLSFF